MHRICADIRQIHSLDCTWSTSDQTHQYLDHTAPSLGECTLVLSELDFVCEEDCQCVLFVDRPSLLSLDFCKCLKNAYKVIPSTYYKRYMHIFYRWNYLWGCQLGSNHPNHQCGPLFQFSFYIRRVSLYNSYLHILFGYKDDKYNVFIFQRTKIPTI